MSINKKELGYFTFRIDPDKMEELKKRGMKPQNVVREGIDKVLNESKCPTCGQKLDPKHLHR